MKLSFNHNDREQLVKINDYFVNCNLDSDVVSSHWKKYGGETFISFDKDFSYVDLRAEGFDDFQQKSILNSIKNIPIDFYLRRKLLPLLPSRLIDGINTPVYALGGLSADDLKDAWAYGAVGTAMLRGAW